MALQKFEKLSINTDSTPSTPRSALSSLAHREHTRNGTSSDTDLERQRTLNQDSFQLEVQPEEGELADREDNDGVQERDFGGIGSSLGTASEISSLEMSLRSRGTAISFDTAVTLEGGHRHLMQSPLPLSGSWTGTDGEVLLSAYDREAHLPRVHSDTETNRYDPETGEPLDRRKERPRGYYRQGEPQFPLLQTTVDELAKDPLLGDPHSIASLTSATTASPIVEEVHTPLNGYLVTESPLDLSTGTSGSTSAVRGNMIWKHEFVGPGPRLLTAWIYRQSVLTQ
jgi:hypothetical protein